MAAMLRLQIPSVELKEENMRASMLAFAGILVCAASAASAQAVIDVEGRRAAQPPAQDQPAAQPQPQVVPQVAPQPTPKVESPVEPKGDDPAAPADGGRFTFNRIDNGYLRLDTQNGQVAYCRAQTAGWSCQAVPENRSELEADVARLQSDMTVLKTLKSDIARSAGRNRRAEAGGRGAERASTAATAGRSDVAGQRSGRDHQVAHA